MTDNNTAEPKTRKTRSVRKIPTIIMQVAEAKLVTTNDSLGEAVGQTTVTAWIDPPEKLRGQYEDHAAARSKLRELAVPGVEYVILGMKERLAFREEKTLVIA